MDERIEPTATGWAVNDADPERSVELWWERFGPPTGRRLLLINGLGSPSVAYELGLIGRFVAAGFEVVRFDNRDVGRSSRCPGERPSQATYTLADMAVDAVEVLDSVGWSTAHLLGQSMGGMIAQQAAIDHPVRVASLTSLMSTTGERGFGKPTKEAMEALMTVPPADREGWIEHRVATEVIWASPEFWDPEVARAKGELLFDHGVDPAGTSRQYRAVAASGSRDEALAALDVPTLVLHGSADTLISPSGGQHTAEVIPGARFVEIGGLGHDLAPGHWDRLVAEVDAFIPPAPPRPDR